MENSNSRIILGALILAVVIYIFYRLMDTTNWAMTYNYQSYEPYGTALFYKSLEASEQHQLLRVDSSFLDISSDSSIQNTSYLFVGVPQFDSLEADGLLQYVHRGNDLHFYVEAENTNFFYQMDYSFLFHLHNEVYMNDFYSDSIKINHLNQKIPLFQVRANLLIKQARWTYSMLDTADSTLESLGYITNELSEEFYGEFLCNYYKTDYGEGQIFIHTTPLLLTNYFMMDSTVWPMAQSIADHITPGKLYWDNYNHYLLALNRPRFRQTTSQSNSIQEPSPISFILDQEALRTAWYIFLASIVLFVIFKSKRKQEIIPIINPPVNKSKVFVEDISQLYQRSSNHKEIAELQKKLVLSKLKRSYGISSEVFKKSSIEELVQKTDLDKEILKNLQTDFLWLERVQIVDNNFLIRLYRSVEAFNASSK